MINCSMNELFSLALETTITITRNNWPRIEEKKVNTTGVK